jgi:hypothetical protein
MKYKISISGRGADMYIHKLNEEQQNVLSEASVDNVIKSKMEYEDINEVLGHPADESDDVYAGVYYNGEWVILVHDENGKLVFESDEDWHFNPEIDPHHESLFEEEVGYLIVESYSKGTFFEYELETDEFDPNKLEPVVVELNERFELLKGVLYDGQEMDFEWGDYDSRGYYYYLTD